MSAEEGEKEPERWVPESKNDEELCTTARLGRSPSTDKFCVHYRDHEGPHHYEGDFK